MSMPDNTRSMEPVRSVRLIFEYEGDRVRLVSQQPVDMESLPVERALVDHPGYYVDSRNAKDATLARVPARSAFVGSVEVFPEKQGEPIHRVDVPTPRGAFTVIVPTPEATDHVTVLQIKPGAPAGDPSARGVAVPAPPAVVDMVSFPLDRRP